MVAWTRVMMEVTRNGRTVDIFSRPKWQILIMVGSKYERVKDDSVFCPE